MIDFAKLNALRDRGGGFTVAEMADVLDTKFTDDSTIDLGAAIKLASTLGLECTVIRGNLDADGDGKGDVEFVYVQHPKSNEPSSFPVSGDAEGAIAICRAIVAELWLNHPGRDAFFAALHAPKDDTSPVRRSNRR